VSPRAGLDDVEKRKFLTLTELELRLLGRPARNQSLSQLLNNLSNALNSGQFCWTHINYIHSRDDRHIKVTNTHQETK
jgi:hypothetical protein